MRGRAASAMVLVVLLVACSGGSKPKVTRPTLPTTASSDVSSDATDASTTTTAPPRLPRALCAAFAADTERRKANSAVDLASLTAAALRARFEAANSSLQAMIDAATGDLKTALEAQLEAQKPGQDAVAEAWGDTGAALAEEARAAGFHDISSYVARDGVTLADGSTVTLASIGRLVVRNLGRLLVGCEDPTLGVRPDELQPRPPSGLIVFTDAGTATVEPTLEVVGTDGSDLQELLPAGTEGRYEAVVGRDGAVAYVAVSADGTTTLRVARSLDSLAQAEDVALPGACPAWAPDRHALVATVDEPVAERGVYLIDAAGKATPVTLPFPALDAGCATFAGPDALIVARTVFGGGVELWRVPLAGEATKVFARTGCNGALGSVAPDGAAVALALSCDDVRSNGIHLVELATGHDEHVAAEIVASGPHFSPDGAWLVASSCPFGCNPAVEMRVTVLRADGTGSRPIVDGQSTWPSWVPSGAVGGPNPKT